MVPGTGTLAFTVTAVPAGTSERIAPAAPPLPVTTGVVMNPVDAVKLTVTPIQIKPLTSLTIASSDPTGPGPVLTADVSVMLAGIFVVDGVVDGLMVDAQPALKQATSRKIQRIRPI